MTTQFRVLTGAALFGVLCYLTAAVAAPPPLASATYKRAAESDIAQLQKHLATCDSDPKEAKRYSPTAKAIAMSLALYGEAAGDAALKKQALKVADQIGKKNYKDALADAKALAIKPGAAPLNSKDLDNLKKFELEEAMAPFRVGTVGGLNIEKDIRGLRDGKITLKPAEVELLAARTASLLHFASKLPNAKATLNKANEAEWDKLSQDSIAIAKKIADEAAKPKTDDKEINKQIKLLDAKCVLCHNKFRDD